LRIQGTEIKPNPS